MERSERRILILAGPNGAGIYKPLVDEWLHYDNAGSEPVLLDRGTKP